jgi:primosomal protein N' (replication factor Y)
MERITLFVDVLLPLPLSDLFTYRVPFKMNDFIKKGQRVVVQFGRQKIYTALIVNIHQKPPENYTIKYILSVLDAKPVVNEYQFKLWKWISSYYMCTLGEIMNAALPSALKLESETKISIDPSFDKDYSLLNEKEYLIAEALENRKILTITEISEIANQKKIMPLIKSLIEKNVVSVEEKIYDSYKPKIKIFVRLKKDYDDENNLKQVFDTLNKRAYKQLQLLMSYITISKRYSKNPVEVTRAELLKNANASSVQMNELIKKGIFEIYQKQVTRLKQYEHALTNVINLNEYQTKAFDEIKEHFKEKNVVLLHGITSSGKTEIYIKLIKEVIKQGKQVLYLLPEIALTIQIINRLRKYFGDKVGVYHSRFNKNEKLEIWNNVLNTNSDKINKSGYQIILGPRSAIFLPFSKLGLVIVDEEHDGSYKQQDPAPRYNGRDTAIYLAYLHNAKTLLGSATPCIESYYNTQMNKYSLVELNKRYGGIQLPEISVVDLKKERLHKKMKSDFSSVLLENIKTALENNEQIILFRNRRGFSLRLECEDCGWMPQCKNCDVTLTYHKYYNRMRCHYCGYSTKIPEKCPYCGSTNIKMKGFGTEKIEEELPVFFKNAHIARMDLDTTRLKNAYQQLIYNFEDHKIDILVGTQMVTKGLDFDNVGVVGIMNADNMLSFPDFRAFERSFQQLAQVSGRAGRKKKRGKVIIQTYNPKHIVVQNVINNDYLAMYKHQIFERKNFNYPPFYRLIKLTLKHKDPQTLNYAAKELAERLRNVFGKLVLGPEYPMVTRIKNLFLKNIIIKLNNNSPISKSKLKLSEQIKIFNKNSNYKGLRIVIDVDPL